MIKKYGLIIAVACIVAGALVAFFGTRTLLSVSIDGIPRTVDTHAFTVAGALTSARIPFHVEDAARPALGSLLPKSGAIQIESARPVHILVQPGNVWFHTYSAEKLPGNILLKAGIRLYPGDQVYLNGLAISANDPLPLAADYTLQVRLTQPITVTRNDQNITFFSSAFSLVQAFGQSGMPLNPGDLFSQPLDSPLLGPTSLVYNPAPLIQVSYKGELLTARSNASTVGGALADAGIALQDLDYTIPAEDQPVPADGNIRVVAVRDAVKVTQIARPFSTEYTTDANVELDTTKVIVPGINGLEVARQHVFTEDGKETSKVSEPSVVLSRPVNAVVAQGTKVVVKYLETPSGTIQYYRSITVHATSYSPCGSGVPGQCIHYTSSRKPVQFGVIAVSLAWYKLLQYDNIYVPGYGVGSVEDVGGGGHIWRYWIDLGYSDEDYVSWDSDVTIYFIYPPTVGSIPLSLP